MPSIDSILKTEDSTPSCSGSSVVKGPITSIIESQEVLQAEDGTWSGSGSSVGKGPIPSILESQDVLDVLDVLQSPTSGTWH